MHHAFRDGADPKWGGLPMEKLIELVRPKTEAKSGGLFSFGRSYVCGTLTYDTPGLKSVLKPAMSADTHMNGSRLPQVYGARAPPRRKPARATKWFNGLSASSSLRSEKTGLERSKGEANADAEYFGHAANV